MLQIDSKSVFRNGAHENDLFIAQPEGFVMKDKRGKAMQMYKALYGFYQPDRDWLSSCPNY